MPVSRLPQCDGGGVQPQWQSLPGLSSAAVGPGKRNEDAAKSTRTMRMINNSMPRQLRTHPVAIPRNRTSPSNCLLAFWIPASVAAAVALAEVYDDNDNKGINRNNNDGDNNNNCSSNAGECQ